MGKSTVRLIIVAALLTSAGCHSLQYEHRVTDEPWSIHLLRIDPGRVQVRAERAGDRGLGREAVSSIATRFDATAAVNGGFFRIGGRWDGEPVGVLKIRRRWYSDPHQSRGAIGWDTSGRVVIDRLAMDWKLELDREVFVVNGINRPRGPGEIVLYTEGFHRSTMTGADGGWEATVVDGIAAAVSVGGNSPIPESGFVVSVGPESELYGRKVVEGTPVRSSFSFRPQLDSHADWRGLTYIVGGTPVLLKAGRILADYATERVRESFARQRHPRTAVCVLADGDWLFAVVDGRQPELSLGMTLGELAEFLHSMQCRDALNLDGGGSSTFFFKRQVRNSPSDITGERPVSDAILVFGN